MPVSRLFLSLALVCCVSLPPAVGVYALNAQSYEPSMTSALEQTRQRAQAVAKSDEVALPPGLEAQAEADRAGAVALVRQALIDDPTILEDALAALEALRAQAETAEMATLIAQNADALFSADMASVMGNPDGAITLVEFLDYNCHFCKRAHQDIMALIETNDDLRVIVKDFPVLGPGSLEAAQVAIAFRQLGGDMTAFIDRMMNETDAPADTALAMQVATELGANENDLRAAMEDPAILEPVGAAYALAETLGITGTPAFIVGEERIMGAVGFDRLLLALQSERARHAAR